MRAAKLLLLSTVVTTAAFAQDLTGIWQGTMTAQRELRIVAQISKGDGAAFKAVLYSIDQSNQGMASSSIVIQDGMVKIIVPGISGGYEGRLNTAVNQMTGTFHQGNNAIPLNLTKTTTAAAWAIPTAPPPAERPMASDASPTVGAATVRLSPPDEPGFGIGVNGRRISSVNTPLNSLIAFAYGLQPKQIVHGPAWMESEKYDVMAEPDAAGIPNPQQLRTMLQKLLADRFQLKFHRDKKELAIYALTVVKTGDKLTRSQGDPNGLPAIGFNGFGRLFARNAKISDFTGTMENTALDRPVVDRTGLTGHYDFTLDWTPDQFQFAGFPTRPTARSSADAPDLYTAIQRQLGMKLEATKAPVEVLVIDRVEKPSGN